MMACVSLILALVFVFNVNLSLCNLRDKVASLSEDGIDLLEQERQLIQKLKEQLEKSSTIPPDASELDVLASSSTSSASCHLLPTEIHVTKEELDESGNTVRTCEGDLQVHKCEGSCSSELRPSITSPTGFAKVNLFNFDLRTFVPLALTLMTFFPEMQLLSRVGHEIAIS